MSIAQKLGQNYESIRVAAKFKTINVNLNDIDFKLKLRIPVKREMDEMFSNITSPTQESIDSQYEILSGPLKKTLQTTDESFLTAMNADSEKIKILENDIIVDGNSIRQIAQMTVIWQAQVEKYFSLLQSETGEPINESYEEIAEEFPDSIIREIIEKIEAAIRPNYKDTKKN